MKSLVDYILFEDEEKFVPQDYDTTVSTETNDNVSLSEPLYKDGINKELNDVDADPLNGGVDINLVGEIRLYSETNKTFYDRKRAIANVFTQKLKSEEVNANRIKFTKIFEYYISHLIQEYRKNIDENCKLNLSTKEELKRQISDDFVLLIRKKDLN